MLMVMVYLHAASTPTSRGYAPERSPALSATDSTSLCPSWQDWDPTYSSIPDDYGIGSLEDLLNYTNTSQG